METDKRAIVEVFDKDCIDVYVNHKLWLKLTELKATNFNGVAFRSKTLYGKV